MHSSPCRDKVSVVLVVAVVVVVIVVVVVVVIDGAGVDSD